MPPSVRVVSASYLMISTEKLLRIVVAVSASTLFLVLVFVYRRLRPSAADVPYVRHAAAALVLSLGVPTVIVGLAHSVAVASLALSGTEEYGRVTIVRFTTGAMLLYTGAMNIALYRAIKAGRRWAIRVSAATCALFCVYLIFLLPLGAGGTVPPMLGAWSVCLPILGAAALKSGPRKEIR